MFKTICIIILKLKIDGGMFMHERCKFGHNIRIM